MYNIVARQLTFCAHINFFGALTAKRACIYKHCLGGTVGSQTEEAVRPKEPIPRPERPRVGVGFLGMEQQLHSAPPLWQPCGHY